MVERAYFDPAARRVIGFAVGTGSSLFGEESSRLIDAGEIEGLGPDALTLADATSATGEETTSRYGELIDLEDLTRRQIYTEGGVHVGGVAGAEFDPASFALTAIETSPGFRKKHTPIAVDQILTIGPELIVVRDEVHAGGEPAPAEPAKDNPVESWLQSS